MTDNAPFAFTHENLEQAKRIIARYPAGRQASAVLPLLDLAQRQNGGWLSRAAMEHVGGLIDMASIRVYEVATFYTMYNLKPIGRHHVRVCTTTPCQLRGAIAVVDACRTALAIELGETTADGSVTLAEVECLGACVNAPVVWIGDDYFEDVDPARMNAILAALRKGEAVVPGPQIERLNSAPDTGLTTLANTVR
ncbi:MAG: NADH-quinone oxidoreductase subunit NuoE [Alphaproteobacteria bacterium]|nr:NADH-quinone oxidoreductase subunit NuoE [Alphaproteobacteria bacterium]